MSRALKALEGDEKWAATVADLMDKVDEFVPEPVREIDKPFLMPVEDVFTITGRGTVITGRVERGVLLPNEEVEIVGIKEKSSKTTVTAIEMFRKTLDDARAGENVGLLLRGTKREEVERGQVVVKPGSVTPHTEFEANAYILSKDEGGRHNPFYANYRPQFYFRTTDVTGVISLPEGTEMVMPGDTTDMTVNLIQPIAMEAGPPLRDPRGWPHRRRRHGHEDRQVALSYHAKGVGPSGPAPSLCSRHERRVLLVVVLVAVLAVALAVLLLAGWYAICLRRREPVR